MTDKQPQRTDDVSASTAGGGTNVLNSSGATPLGGGDMHRVVVGDATLQARIDGTEGPWVLLVHPLGADHTIWEATAAHLAGRYRVLRVDLRGHGKSDAPVGPYTMIQMADDIVALMDGLDVPQAHYVGLSIGGMVGQVLGVRYPERFHSLTLADTSSHTPLEAHPMWHERIGSVEAHGMAGVVDPTLNRWLTEPFRAAHPEVVEKIRAMVLATPVRGYVGASLAILGFDQADALSRIHCPTLVLVGDQDPGCPVDQARAIAEAIPGAQFEILQDAAHIGPIEQPERFHAILDAFLCRAACGSQCETP